MSRNIESYLKLNSLGDIANNESIHQYSKNIEKFADWAKAQGFYVAKKVEDPKDLIQRYVDDLIERGKTPSTIHTYIAPVCKGWGVRMDEIDKPKRGRTVKGTDEIKNMRGQKEAAEERNERVVRAAASIGIRRTELFKLKGRNLTRDAFGNPCIEVERGKGGKYHMQRILPDKLDVLQTVFAELGADERVFDKAELRSSRHIDIHSIRRDVAKEAYQYYKEKIDQGKADKLRSDLSRTFMRYHKGDPATKKFQGQYKKYMDEICKHSVYRLRGDSKAYAVKHGLPVEYDRLALMCVSVWHLSHWRLDVTVKNYMNV